jgi:two-component system, NtrC family, response regulator HydG
VTTLLVVSRTESFSALWPRLAAESGLAARVVDGPEDAASDVAAAVLSLAGAEEEGEPLLRAMAAAGHAAVLVAGARADHRLASSLLRAGAGDYFALPEDLDALRAAIRESAAARARGDAAEASEAAAGARRAFDFGRIVGRSPQLRTALDRAARAIPHARASVLITGETGTGKELLAQAIHDNGPRGRRPFVELNCAAVPAGLLESELFGHERGAFTDAHAARPGLFEAADGGTLFLDEIGDLALPLQGKILKVLDDGRVRRVGAVRARTMDVRIIAATHADLPAAVARREFREDLYYRLSVIPIHLPPLRERDDDVVVLAEHFLADLAGRYGMPVPTVTPALRRALLGHPWPGNVRELRNSLERALLLGDGRPHPDDLFRDPAAFRPPAAAGALPFPARLQEIERAAAVAALAHAGGNKSEAAQLLGISRSRLYRLLGGADVAE